MKVLFVIHYPIFGGPHNQALRLNEELSHRGWDTVVLLPEGGNAAERLREGGVDVVQMPLHRVRASLNPQLHFGLGVGLIPEVRRIRRLIRDRKIDLVMIGGLVNPHAAIAARLEGIPCVWQILDSRTPGMLRRVTMPVVRQFADSVMFTGESLVDLHTGGRPLSAPSFIYYAPVDTARFMPSSERRHATRQKYNIPDQARVVGLVGNLNPQKGIEYFIRAAAMVYRSQPDCWFLIVGSRYETHRKYSALLQAEVEQSGVPPERFIFTGNRPDVENYYPAMDVKLITSVPRSEGTPTTAMEALACGVPVVATDVGAVSEVVEDGVTGAIVPPLNSRAIARATLRLLQDGATYARMSENGSRRALERFDVKVCADTHLRAFEAALGRKARSPRFVGDPVRSR